MNPDEKDQVIISMFAKDPNVSQDDIAGAIGLSQPSVAARIKKLRDSGALVTQTGIDPFRVGLQVGKIDVTTTNPAKILDMFHSCPYFMNGIIVSGKSNLTLFFMAEKISTLEAIVDGHLRRLPEVQEVDFNIVISPGKQMVVPVVLSWDKRDKGPCGVSHSCKGCGNYEAGRCSGCPIVVEHKGWFF